MKSAIRVTAVLAGPIGLGLLAAVHPLVDGTLIPADDIAIWTLIHTLQLPLAALLGISVIVLLDGIDSGEARVARIAVVPWVAAFAAFDAVAGLATGAISEYGRANPEQAEAALGAGMAIAASPMVSAALPLGAFLASIIVFGGAAVALRQAGASLGACLGIGAGGALWTFVHPLVGAPAMLAFAGGAVLVLVAERRARMVADLTARAAAW